MVTINYHICSRKCIFISVFYICKCLTGNSIGTVTYVNKLSTPQNLFRHSCSQIFQWLTISERITYNIHLFVLHSSNSVLLRPVVFLANLEKLVTRYVVRTWLYSVLELKTTYHFHFVVSCSFWAFRTVQASWATAVQLPLRWVQQPR